MKKLNKKGFTLVELVAVIAILSILMVLALPQVLKLFNQGKENAFITQAQSLYKAAEEQWLANQMVAGKTGDNVFCYAEDGEDNPLDLSGTEDVYYRIEFNAQGDMISFKVKQGSYGVDLPADDDTVVTLNSIERTEELPSIECGEDTTGN